MTIESAAPSVGRIVHYVSYGTPGGEYASRCRSALITEVDPVNPELVGLAAINPTGMFFHPLSDGGCRLESPAGKGGTWHWPERI